MMMSKNKFLIIFSFLVLISCGSDEIIDPGPEKDYPGYSIVWQDEFNSTLNTANWSFELGDGTDYGLPPGWGNNEKQIYTNSQNNAIIKPDGNGNSVLAIVVRENGSSYTSSKLTTQNLHGFRFGRIEARVKLPSGRGLWPAFWMLGENIDQIDWPGCGEIDIVELIGQEPNVAHSSAYYTTADNKIGTNTNNLTSTLNLSDDYHLYRLDWTPNSMIFSLDEQEVNQIAIEADMKEFLRSFYIIFNVAVGGNWPGDPDETTVFPQEMWIDWIRVYSQDDLNIPNEPSLDIQEETIGFLLDFWAHHAFNDDLNQFEDIGLKSFGGGGEPLVTLSENAVDGDTSLMLTYPGSSWGGAFFELESPIDATQYSSGNVVFSIDPPDDMTDIEIKLESVSNFFSVYLVNYIGMDLGNGFFEYRIPLSDFEGLDLTELRIPFALWNPVVSSGDYLNGSVLVDNIYFEE